MQREKNLQILPMKLWLKISTNSTYKHVFVKYFTNQFMGYAMYITTILSKQGKIIISKISFCTSYQNYWGIEPLEVTKAFSN